MSMIPRLIKFFKVIKKQLNNKVYLTLKIAQMMMLVPSSKNHLSQTQVLHKRKKRNKESEKAISKQKVKRKKNKGKKNGQGKKLGYSLKLVLIPQGFIRYKTIRHFIAKSISCV